MSEREDCATKQVWNNGWFDVKDRVPKSDNDGYTTDVLTYSPEYGINIDCFSHYRDEWTVHGKATHWMPLPEPPK